MRNALARLAVSTTRRRAIRASSTVAPTDGEPTIISDTQLAWLLIDAAGSCLAGADRTNFFVELGCGESYLAIEHILTEIISSKTALSGLALSALTRWLRGYAGTPAEPQLRKMLSDIRLQQFQVINGDRDDSPDANPSPADCRSRPQSHHRRRIGGDDSRLPVAVRVDHPGPSTAEVTRLPGLSSRSPVR